MGPTLCWYTPGNQTHPEISASLPLIGQPKNSLISKSPIIWFDSQPQMSGFTLGNVHLNSVPKGTWSDDLGGKGRTGRIFTDFLLQKRGQTLED